MKALSRLQTLLPPPLPTLPQSPDLSRGDINSSLFPVPTMSTPPRAQSTGSPRTESSAALNESLKGPEPEYPLDRRRSLEKKVGSRSRYLRKNRKPARAQGSAAVHEALEGLKFPNPLDRRRTLEKKLGSRSRYRRKNEKPARAQGGAAVHEALEGLTFPDPLD